MAHLIEVAFRGNRKEFFQWEEETVPALKAGIIVEADRGEDFGRVHATGELAEVRCRGCAHGCGTAPPPRKALRLATREEDVREREMGAENESARRRAFERVKANGLVMKLTDAEWQWDRRKLTFYFTAERRVDFRALVRDLAAMFRTRIELKQIGVRDEAKRLSGVGRCGREYCSSSWLPDLRPVNLGVAKDQKLSLNPQQISGACGRLMCCLRYEHEFYVQSRRRFPKEGKILQTKLGEEKVVSCDIFNDRVTLRTAEGDSRVVPLAELREEIGGFDGMHATDTHEVPSDIEDMAIDHDDARANARAGAKSRPPRSTPSNRPAVRSIERIAEPVVADVITTAVPPAPPQAAPAVAAPAVAAPVVAAPLPPVAAVEPAAIAEAASTADAPADARADDAAEQPEGTEDGPRRKRRRGRRGGRRLRAAEQRRKSEGGSDDGTSSDDALDDGDADDGGSDHDDDASPSHSTQTD